MTTEPVGSILWVPKLCHLLRPGNIHELGRRAVAAQRMVVRCLLRAARGRHHGGAARDSRLQNLRKSYGYFWGR
jgi:hypothetical protein